MRGSGAVIAKWGNSLAVRLPHVVADEAGFTEDTKVKISFDQGKIVISREITLDDMLNSLTKENSPIYQDMGEPVGKELFM